MDSTIDRPAAAPRPSKAVNTGVIRMKFEMSDCHIHLWIGSTAQWEAGPGASRTARRNGPTGPRNTSTSIPPGSPR